MIGYKIITQPAVEPVDATLFRQFKRSDFSADDNLLNNLFLPAARAACEQYTNRKFINTTIEQSQDKFEYTPTLEVGTYEGIGAISNYSLGTPYIKLSGGLIQSITSLKVYDINNVETTISSDDYFLDDASMRLVLKSTTYTLPSLRDVRSIVVRYVAGFGATAASVPADIKQAIIQTAEASYDYNRTTQEVGFLNIGLPEIVKQMLNGYKIIAGRLN